MKRLLIIAALSLFSLIMVGQDCSVPTGVLTWNNPDGFNDLEDRVLVFAKKVPLGTNTYMDVGDPSETAFGDPDTSLLTLEGVVPITIQYENDPLGMLVYDGIGETVTISGMEDSTYYFTVFNVDNGVYSNSIYARGKTVAVDGINRFLMASISRIQWVMPNCFDFVLVALSQDVILDEPSGFADQYLVGLTNDWNTTTSALSDAKILYVGQTDRMTMKNVPKSVIYISIWVNVDDCWSKVKTKTIDTR